MQVLLVEDNPDDVVLLRAAVASEASGDFDLVHAESLATAEDVLAKNDIALIVLDLSLPDADGLEALSRLSALPTAVPIIVLTGRYGAELSTQALRLGAHDYLLKDSIDGHGLNRCFRYAIERHQLTRQLADEVHVTTALARVSQRLMSARSTTDVLTILCRTGRDTLGAESARVLWCEHDPPALRPLMVEPSPLAATIAPTAEPEALLSQLAREVLVFPAAQQRRATNELLTYHLALRREGQLIGALELRYPHGDGVETGPRRRILQGLNQIATQALGVVHQLEELVEVNRARSHLDAMLSHELRNALNVVIGSTDLALGESPEDWVGREFLELARRRAGESLDLIRAILEISHSESALAAEIQPVDVIELMSELGRELHTILGSSTGVELRWHIESSLAGVRSDPLKLRLIARNLIHNALKFTTAGKIDVSIVRLGAHLELSVRDSGIGIPAGEIATIFEPFSQAHGQHSRGAGGAGLGLYIVRRLVESLNGTITVSSRVGEGSTFHVSIPIE